jgi:hypothetical protein
MFEFKLDVPKDQPIVGVRTTDKRGFTPEELAEQCVAKIISVSDTAHPGLEIRLVPSRSISKRLSHSICGRLFAATAQQCIMH